MKVYLNNYLQHLDKLKILLIYGDDYDKYRGVLDSIKNKYNCSIRIYQQHNYAEIFEETYRQQGLFGLEKPILQLENLSQLGNLEKSIASYLPLIRPILIINGLDISSKLLKKLIENKNILSLALYNNNRETLNQNLIQSIRFNNYHLINQVTKHKNLTWLLAWNLKIEQDILFNNLESSPLSGIYYFYNHTPVN